MLSPPKKITELPSKTATPDPKDTAQIEYLYVSALSFRLRDSTATAVLHLRHPLEAGFSRVPPYSVLRRNPEYFNGFYSAETDNSTREIQMQPLFLY